MSIPPCLRALQGGGLLEMRLGFIGIIEAGKETGQMAGNHIQGISDYQGSVSREL